MLEIVARAILVGIIGAGSMTPPPADLLAEARALIAVAPWTRDAEVARAARTLLPQLADALEAAETKIGIMQRNIEFNEKAYLAEHVTWGNCQWKARLVKVRERAIKEEELPTGYICKRCAL